ncbi:MAG TPA: hypothetical protein PLR98_03600 [Chitinophagaceae bacterium]|nr:hypothetical protein [Chitinophagaceae bacterium]
MQTKCPSKYKDAGATEHPQNPIVN